MSILRNAQLHSKKGYPQDARRGCCSRGQQRRLCLQTVDSLLELLGLQTHTISTLIHDAVFHDPTCGDQGFDIKRVHLQWRALVRLAYDHAQTFPFKRLQYALLVQLQAKGSFDSPKMLLMYAIGDLEPDPVDELVPIAIPAHLIMPTMSTAPYWH